MSKLFIKCDEVAQGETVQLLLDSLDKISASVSLGLNSSTKNRSDIKKLIV